MGGVVGRSGSARALAIAAVVVALGCGGSPSQAPRHLVLVSLDTLSAKHVGAYGYGRDTTPNLDALARDGVLFENAYTPQAWTLTAHASLLTGLYPAAHGAGRKESLSSGAITLAEYLKGNGFRTVGLFGRVGWLSSRYGFGRGFDRYQSAGARTDAHDRFLDRFFQRQAEILDDEPLHRFFLFVHYYEPHSDVGTAVPYWAPDPYRLRYLGGTLDWKHRGDTKLLTRLQAEGAVTERDREVITALYDGGVRYTDEARLGRLLLALRESGLADDTLLVVTSDHGEEMFQHGKCSHQQPYEEIARVPLVMRGPGLPRGLRVPEVVELVDVMPTVLSLLGLPAVEGLQGRDLVPRVRGGTLPPRPAHVDGILGSSEPLLSHNQSALVARVDGRRWSYVGRFEATPGDRGRRFRPDPDRELYLLDEDPDQTENLADAYPEVASRLEAMLLEWYDANEAHRHRIGAPEKQEDMLDAEQREQLRALGYAE